MVTKHSRAKPRTRATKAPSREEAIRKYYKGLTIIPPPKSVEQLAKEQGLWGRKFDYVALATAVWPTKKDVEEFEQFLEDIRGRPSD